MHNQLQWVSCRYCLSWPIAHEAGTLNAHSEILLGHQLCYIEFAKRNSADSSFISGRKESEEGGVTSTAGDGGRYILRNSGHQFHCGIAVRPRNAGVVLSRHDQHHVLAVLQLQYVAMLPFAYTYSSIRWTCIRRIESFEIPFKF